MLVATVSVCVCARASSCWLFVTHHAFISWQTKNAGEIKFQVKKQWNGVINNVEKEKKVVRKEKKKMQL